MTHAPDPISIAAGLPYQPIDPVDKSRAIGLIGCGGITKHHLEAYRDAGYTVAALCDVDLGRAEQRRDEFFPDAAVFDDYRDLLKIDEIRVVDVATHTAIRPPIVTDALQAEKHVLSQKPFVEDLDIGQRLVDLADRKQVKLAVNQNGRWAPHFSYCREAIRHNVIGELNSALLSVHWDHTWVKGTPFESVPHLVLFDYAIHWFDITTCFFGTSIPQRVSAALSRTSSQPIDAPLLANVGIEYEDSLATLVFNAQTRAGREDRSCLVGTQGTIHSWGPNEKEQRLELHLREGTFVPELQGCWFSDGFHGTMGELLCSIEDNREPSISARENLRSLELCFAAVASAMRGEPVRPGSVRALPMA